MINDTEAFDRYINLNVVHNVTTERVIYHTPNRCNKRASIAWRKKSQKPSNSINKELLCMKREKKGSIKMNLFENHDTAKKEEAKLHSWARHASLCCGSEISCAFLVLVILCVARI